ncbi:MAG: hypothetical protein QXS20_09455 [Candidatus Thorarchaeota archaeon]
MTIPYTKGPEMKQIALFDLRLDRPLAAVVKGSDRRLSVEVFVDTENTTIVIDCSCCRELLTNKLPGGALIPITSSLKRFFESRNMRNIGVRVSGNTMRRVYRGVLDPASIPELHNVLQESLDAYNRNRPRGSIAMR